jgi:hypothetical protein
MIPADWKVSVGFRTSSSKLSIDILSRIGMRRLTKRKQTTKMKLQNTRNCNQLFCLGQRKGIKVEIRVYAKRHELGFGASLMGGSILSIVPCSKSLFVPSERLLYPSPGRAPCKRREIASTGSEVTVRK